MQVGRRGAPGEAYITMPLKTIRGPNILQVYASVIVFPTAVGFTRQAITLLLGSGLSWLAAPRQQPPESGARPQTHLGHWQRAYVQFTWPVHANQPPSCCSSSDARMLKCTLHDLCLPPTAREGQARATEAPSASHRERAQGAEGSPFPWVPRLPRLRTAEAAPWSSHLLPLSGKE